MSVSELGSLILKPPSLRGLTSCRIPIDDPNVLGQPHIPL